MWYRARSWDEVTGRFDRSGFVHVPSRIRKVARAMSSRHGHCEIVEGRTLAACRQEGHLSIVEVWYGGKVFESRLYNPR